MHDAVKSAFADCDIVLRIVEVQKTAGGFVDHALVPLKHESEPILEDPGTPRFGNFGRANLGGRAWVRF